MNDEATTYFWEIIKNIIIGQQYVQTVQECKYQKYIEAATSAALSLITNLGFGHPGILRGAVSEFAIQYTSHDVITDYSQYCIR
ncbi:S-adenosylmethionine synthase [Dirofilaria immitis]